MKNSDSIKIFPISFTIFLVLMILKLTGVLVISWWWVTSPLWIPVALGLVGVVFALAFLGMAALTTRILQRSMHK